MTRSLTQEVKDFSKEIMANPLYVVSFNRDKIKSLMDSYQQVTKPNKQPFSKKVALFAIFDSALQFCFWYGSPERRPFQCSSSSISKIMSKIFLTDMSEEYLITGLRMNFGSITFKEQIKTELRLGRFTMLPERMRIVDELFDNIDILIKIVTLMEEKQPIDVILLNIVTHLDCFAKDLFLKKAFLIFCTIDRMLGGYFDDIDGLPIPADYQIPKMLRMNEIIKYNMELERYIANSEPIISGSRHELEIRAATIVVAELIKEDFNVIPNDLDNYLFGIRNRFNYQHHLCITEDY